MGTKHDDALQQQHNQAQTDYSEGVYNPPTKSAIVEFVEGYSQEECDRIGAYKKGYANAKKQG